MQKKHVQRWDKSLCREKNGTADDCFSLEKLKEAIRQALELDLSIKTGQINDRTAVEILICSLAAE